MSERIIITPKVKGFICITSHPDGCMQNVKNQIQYVEKKGSFSGKKNVLVIGSSTGYGLASRIVSTFGNQAKTIGVMLEREGKVKKPASAGYYNTLAFEKICQERNIYAKTINADAFSHETKQKTIEMIQKDLGQIDLVIYSLASPKRKSPDTDEIYSSTLKPIGETYSTKTVDANKAIVKDITLEGASEDEINHTQKVMGGEDWLLWIEVLLQANALSNQAQTVAYSYIGPELTYPIYRNGTIGKAKEHLEATALVINQKLKDIQGEAMISINKALVTQASSAIPVVPLYVAILYKIMKEKKTHEGCIEQIDRLYRNFLFHTNNNRIVDGKNRIRIDELELDKNVQSEVLHLWEKINTDNLHQFFRY